MIGKILIGFPLSVILVAPMITFFVASLPYITLKRLAYNIAVWKVRRTKDFRLPTEERDMGNYALSLFKQDKLRLLLDIRWSRDCFMEEMKDIGEGASFAWLFWSCIFWGVIAYLIWGPVS